MRIIPVIDLRNNQAVHAVKGDRASYKPVKSVLCNSSDPVEIAVAFRDRLGLSEIYIADLDAIENPRSPGNQDLIKQLSSEEKIDVVLDAGVSDTHRLSKWLNVGVHKIVIGSETVETLIALEDIPGRIDPERIIFSLDCRDGHVLSKCPELQALSPFEALKYAQSYGWRELILLDLARVGSGYGINRSFIAETRANFPVFTLLVGGGITGPEEIRELKALDVEGVLVATALHRGIISPQHIHELNL